MRWPRLRPEYRGESPHLARLPGRAKLSPKLQPLTIRNAGGQVPGIRFYVNFYRKRQRRKASEARQARRASPCGQGSAAVGACGQPVGLSICAHVGLSCPSGRTQAPGGCVFSGWGSGGGAAWPRRPRKAQRTRAAWLASPQISRHHELIMPHMLMCLLDAILPIGVRIAPRGAKAPTFGPSPMVITGITGDNRT